DFGGRETALATVLEAGPSVFNHNLETCRRLTPAIRAGARYDRSLAVLRAARRLQTPPAGSGEAPARIKSGFMLGLGETTAEIRELLGDLRAANVELLVIGQYLPPSRQHWPLARYVPPAEFATWEQVARTEFGFAAVVSRPLARSSYLAENLARA
ncbi:MAG: lipoyl synthase, partial [bacterium]